MVRQVDFYVLEDEAKAAADRVACRIAEKAWQQGHRVYMLVADARAVEALDDLLWTFRQQSFVPHVRVDDAQDTVGRPVLIGAVDRLPAGVDVLINRAEGLPHCANDCPRVADVVAGDARSREQARARYRQYRDAGDVLRSHEVTP